MPVQHSLHVALTETLYKYINDQIMAGHYATASEVVRAALRLLVERDRPEEARKAASVIKQSAGA